MVSQHSATNEGQSTTNEDQSLSQQLTGERRIGGGKTTVKSSAQSDKAKAHSHSQTLKTDASSHPYMSVCVQPSTVFYSPLPSMVRIHEPKYFFLKSLKDPNQFRSN